MAAPAARAAVSSGESLGLVHLVALRFKPDMSEAQIVRHFEEEVALARRMPELVRTWSFHRNVSVDSRRDVNGGCGWVVVARLWRAEDLPAYLSHPEHKEVGRIQAPLLDGKFVADWVVPGRIGGGGADARG